jgi:DNA polymerase-1
VPGPLLTIDGPFVLYRSFFALPDSITDGDGHAVNALLGAVNLILRIAADCGPRVIVVCFGAEAAAYRTELYPAYHADRPPAPDALDWQFQRAPELFAAFGWLTATTDDLEADDLLGAFSEAEVDAGGRALIMTGDRDMYQCAAENVSVVYLKQRSAGFDEVDPQEVHRRYGVVPSLVPDFIALRGDPSDGLPGAPGIGPKTAAELLDRYGSLEAVIAAADDQRPRIAGSLRDNADELLAFRDIATLRPADVALPEDAPTNLAGGAEAARALGMNRLAERLENASSLTDL